MCRSSDFPKNGRNGSSTAIPIMARTPTTNGPAPGMASRATSAGSNPRPTKCTSACCSRATVPTRPVRIVRANVFNRKRCFTKCGLRNESEPPPPMENFALRTPQSALTLADFYQLPIRDALRFVEQIAARHQSKPSDPIGLVLNEVRSRLGYLVEVGLGYLTLDRPTRTLSGGETERVNLTTCLGTRLVNTLYVLDEPSVGLHPRDTGRLIRILEQLRDLGNTVLVVEHEASVIRAADQIVDLGPGHGEGGGHVVFHGSYSEILQSKESLTGQYLTGRKRVEIPRRRPVPRPANDSAPEPVGNPEDAASTFRLPCLILRGASLHNLRNLTVPIPLRRLVCITGVSGSGKTTLVREVLLPALQATLKSQAADRVASDRFEDENEDDSPAAIKRQPS